MKQKLSTHMEAEMSSGGKRTGKEKLGMLMDPFGGGRANCSQFEQVQLKAAAKEVM